MNRSLTSLSWRERLGRQLGSLGLLGLGLDWSLLGLDLVLLSSDKMRWIVVVVIAEQIERVHSRHFQSKTLQKAPKIPATELLKP